MPAAPLRSSDQEEPPSVVFIMIPASPTLYPVFPSINHTDRKFFGVPLYKEFQDEPPSRVLSIVPDVPTTNPLF